MESPRKNMSVSIRVSLLLSKSTILKENLAVYGRLDNNGHFLTALTSLVPNAKNGKILHPTV